ncbi:MAG: P1 family peptidase [Micrococcales bacterium]|nr:P1 family peptidase [Micrococcales bacterium]
MCKHVATMPPAFLAQSFGRFPTGPSDSVLDVPGAGLGHATIVRDDADPPTGSGIARTGVTVVDPGGDVWANPVPAGVAVLNGAGELTGSLQIQEWGVTETPVFLTSTMQVGRVYDAACRLLMVDQPEIADSVVIPVVGECDDSWLNDPRTMHVSDADVAEALAQARSSATEGLPPSGRAVLSGCVGAGTGTVCMGWKGGIGTSSRVLPDGTTVAVVLLTNFGAPHQLTIRGRVVGEELEEPAWWAAHHPEPAGSCIGVVVTDAPLDPATASRVAARVGLGLARCGSVAHHGSGEIFCCLATGLRAPRGAASDRAPWPGSRLDDLFEATVDATESAVWDSLLSATTTTGRRGLTVPALPRGRLEALIGAT